MLKTFITVAAPCLLLPSFICHGDASLVFIDTTLLDYDFEQAQVDLITSCLRMSWESCFFGDGGGES